MTRSDMSILFLAGSRADEIWQASPGELDMIVSRIEAAVPSEVLNDIDETTRVAGNC